MRIDLVELNVTLGFALRVVEATVKLFERVGTSFEPLEGLVRSLREVVGEVQQGICEARDDDREPVIR